GLARVYVPEGGLSSSFATSASICSGVVDDPYRFTTSPCASTRNFVKFHLIPLVPIAPGASAFRCSYSGCACAPLTSILANSGNVTSYFVLQNVAISSADPGSWPPNWLQGNPSTSKPR